MKNKFYITTPIYYVNAQPHIGHTYTTIAADVLARYHRDILGEPTFFLTGTDEHGAKIAEKAKEEKKELQVFVDEVAEEFVKAWRALNISNDNFIRTTDEKHMAAVQKALRYMYDKGDIYKGSYKGLYCRGCEQFKNEKDLIDGKCPDHKTEPEQMSEETYLFKMSKYQDKLLAKVKSDELKIRPEGKKNEMVSFIEKEGLQDVSFSRKNLAWGVPLPWDASHTSYVWADAFLNYLTGLGWKGPKDKCPKMWPAETQLMSKDILRVHATIWQAMLLSLDLPTSKELFIHGFFLADGQKMSKSLGNVIAPQDLVKKYGIDASRYLLMSATVFGSDGDIGWQKFDEKYNADLANGLGNLIARVSNILEKDSIKVNIKSGNDQALKKEFGKAMQNLRIDEALKILWGKLRQNDEKLSSAKPWEIKEIDAKKKILEPIAQDILNVAELLQPFMPETAEKIIKQFSAKQIKKGESLFPRI
ncbi:methionine--tRNA ligase [Candidatus Falkowbacteria bacterium CG10_big_fil_rev_8_21_14_0_10_43_10]|uniref:Methionine--tRNA ligase n=1 Tax=Candidatus Falkowbacteria bacterium CG10_big_fil_rev_8_21_14_0_10_43_10 TaxID=1974567 RepID=A0A2H0V2Y4_9BACT|nr:MAG: methionine--tRNA ligase [Candidatus Falkowbacteria bacterium CG10_big_fil_rev_8_21_14_0_10_43_10]